MVPKQCPFRRPTFWYLVCCATCLGSRDNSKYHTYLPTYPPTHIHTWPNSDFHRLFDSGFAPSALSLRLNNKCSMPYCRNRCTITEMRAYCLYLAGKRCKIYRVSQNYPNMYFSTIISTYCAETTEDVDTKIFWNTNQRAKINATHLPSPLMTPFSHYFRLALKICFSLCAQVPNRQLLTRGAFTDSTIERLTSYLLEGLQINCETSWISVALKFSSS